LSGEPNYSNALEQDGSGRRIGIPFGSSEATCPGRAVKAWLETACIADGPVFRALDRFQRVQPGRLSAERVALIVKRRAKTVGLHPARRGAQASEPGWRRVRPRRGLLSA
jgi:hypothetical protein